MKRIALLVVSTLFLTFVPMAHAETVGTLDGAFSYPGYVNQQFNGSLCAAPNVCEVIPGYQNFPSRQISNKVLRRLKIGCRLIPIR